VAVVAVATSTGRPGDPQPDKVAFPLIDRNYSHLLRELPGGAVGVSRRIKSDFLVDGLRPVLLTHLMESRLDGMGAVGKLG